MKPRRISVRGIIFKDGKLLCVRHKAYNADARPNYATPGGGLEDGESLVDGVTRELIEETGVTPKVGKLLFIQQFKTQSGLEVLDMLFHIENPEDFTDIDLSQTTHGELEIAEIGFIDPTGTTIQPSFLGTIDLASYINEDKPTLVFDNFSE